MFEGQISLFQSLETALCKVPTLSWRISWRPVLWKSSRLVFEVSARAWMQYASQDALLAELRIHLDAFIDKNEWSIAI